MKDVFPMPVPQPDVAGSSRVPTIGKETYSAQDETLGGSAPIEEYLD